MVTQCLMSTLASLPLTANHAKVRTIVSAVGVIHRGSSVGRGCWALVQEPGRQGAGVARGRSVGPATQAVLKVTATVRWQRVCKRSHSATPDSKLAAAVYLHDDVTSD